MLFLALRFASQNCYAATLFSVHLTSTRFDQRLHITFPDRLTVVIGGRPEKSHEGARFILFLVEGMTSNARFGFCMGAIFAKFLHEKQRLVATEEST